MHSSLHVLDAGAAAASLPPASVVIVPSASLPSSSSPSPLPLVVDAGSGGSAAAGIPVVGGSRSREEAWKDSITEWQSAFGYMDRASPDAEPNQTITAEKLSATLRSLGYVASRAEVQDMIDEVDTSGSGSISFANFLSFVTSPMAAALSADPSAAVPAERKHQDPTEQKVSSKREEVLSLKQVAETFQCLDKDRKGYIVADDVRKAFVEFLPSEPPLSDDTMYDIMRRMDPDGMQPDRTLRIRYEAYTRVMLPPS